jgi:hypothetical protein
MHACVGDVGDVATAIFQSHDVAGNMGTLNLTTTVVDTHPPVLSYSSLYPVMKVDGVTLEVVEAHRQQRYQLGTIAAEDPPLSSQTELRNLTRVVVNRGIAYRYCVGLRVLIFL